MRRLLIVLLSGSLHAATYYVASTGNDANAGSAGSPWLSLNHAVNTVACGDTINVVADGSYVAGDANLPYLPGCGMTTNIQSSKLSQFKPLGYRTNPVNDSAIYGKLVLTGTGITAQAEAHGSNQKPGGSYLSRIGGMTTDTITMTDYFGTIPSGWLHNGSQVTFDVSSNVAPLATAPTGFSLFTKYYVVNCSTSPACGTNGSTFQIATTSGGSPLSGFTCTGYVAGITPGCAIGAIFFSVPLQVAVGSANIVMSEAPTNWIVGTPLAFSAVSAQQFNTLPGPLAVDTPYYITSLSSATIQVSAILGGSPITITSNGTGPLMATNTDVANNWAFRGLEIVDGSGRFIFELMTLGNTAASSVIGVVNHIEVDRSYLHSQNNGGEARGIADNASYLNIHDSYFSGFSSGEAQAISGWGSPGPTVISNNFLEGAGEIILYGGNDNNSGTANANKLITGNYAHKPPTWRYRADNGTPTGSCLYSGIDPDRTGGEWYTDVGPLSVDSNSRPANGGFQVLGGGGGSGGTLIATMTGGVITSLTVGLPGSGYVSNFTINNSNFVVASGSGFSATVTVGGGVLTGATITTGGSGFSPANGSTQKYRCGPNGQWAMTTSTWPNYGNPLVKTGWEHKNGRYLTYVGNVLDTNWTSGQAGQCYNFNQESGSSAGFANDHITFINNKCVNIYQFGNRGSACSITVLVLCVHPPSDFNFANNLVLTNPLTCGFGFTTASGTSACGYGAYQGSSLGGDGNGNPSAIAMQFQNDNYQHITLYAPDPSAWTFTGHFPAPMFLYSPLIVGTCPTHPTMNTGVNENNILPGDYVGVCSNTTLISSIFTNFTFTNNAMLVGSSAFYASPGATNTWANTVYPATNSVIKYANADGTPNGDYHLDPTSPYSAANSMATRLSTDGTDLGADIDMVNMATSGALAGTPPWNVMYGPRINPGSMKLLLSYEAPTTAACTATIYSAAARIAANQVASVADSAASSISDILTRQLYVSGLTASTHYWYKLVCGGGVIMVGDFSTRPAGSGTYTFTFDWSSATAMRYSTSASMSGAVTLAAATRQLIPVAANTVVYAQAGTTGPITILVTP